MSDTTYDVFQHYDTHAARLAFVPNPAAGIKPLYLWYETDTDNMYVYTNAAWHGPVNGGAGTVTHTGSLTAGDLVIGNGTADLKTVAATDGQIPIGRTSDGNVVLSTLTAGANITITNGAGTITIASSGGGGTGTPSFGFFMGS